MTNFEKYLIPDTGMEGFFGDTLHKRMSKKAAPAPPPPETKTPEKSKLLELSEEQLKQLQTLRTKCVSEIKATIRKSQHKVAAPGFSISTEPWNDIDSDWFEICDWNLWDIYPEGKDYMRSHGIDEYIALEREILAICTKIYKPCTFVHVENACDWDGGCIGLQLNNQ